LPNFPMSDYSRYYAVLEATPDAGWNALRARYRRLIGQWHPDRFSGDAPEREVAEERSKQITIAYRALERYYRDHGILPPLDPVTMPEEAQATPEDAADPDGAHAAGGAAAADPVERESPKRAGRRRRVLVALCAIGVAWFAYRHSDDALVTDGATEDAGSSEAAAPAPQAAGTQPEPLGISAGSTLGEVYAIQGIPTQTQGDIWYYGKSSIRFAHGKVVSWTQHPDNPLRVARDQPVYARRGYFEVGSTKDEVRSIQGSPVTESETVWDYGPSRVYFEHGRVVRWETSPLQPLRVPH
jgi:DnaJ-like protein